MIRKAAPAVAALTLVVGLGAAAAATGSTPKKPAPKVVTYKLSGALTFKNVTATYRTRLTQEQTSQTTVMDKLPEK